MNARIFSQVTHDLIYLQNELLAVADMKAMVAFLRQLQQQISPDAPMIMVVAPRSRPGEFQIFNVDWSTSWIKLYRQERFALVDPVLAGPTGEPICWSQTMSAARNYHSRHYRRFLDIARLHGMLAGLTWIEETEHYRITLSMIGRDIENNDRAHAVLGLLMGRVAGIVSRLLQPHEKLIRLSAPERNILQCLLDGLSDEQSAERTGLSTRTTRERINKIKLLHGASNRSHLLKILFNLELPQSDRGESVFARIEIM